MFLVCIFLVNIFGCFSHRYLVKLRAYTYMDIHFLPRRPRFIPRAQHRRIRKQGYWVSKNCGRQETAEREQVEHETTETEHTNKCHWGGPHEGIHKAPQPSLACASSTVVVWRASCLRDYGTFRPPKTKYSPTTERQQRLKHCTAGTETNVFYGSYPWLAAARLIPGPAVDARTSLAVVSPSYHGDCAIRLGREP